MYRCFELRALLLRQDIVPNISSSSYSWLAGVRYVLAISNRRHERISVYATRCYPLQSLDLLQQRSNLLLPNFLRWVDGSSIQMITSVFSYSHRLPIVRLISRLWPCVKSSNPTNWPLPIANSIGKPHRPDNRCSLKIPFSLPPRCPQVVWCHWGEIEPFSATLIQDGLAECDQPGKIPRNTLPWLMAHSPTELSWLTSAFTWCKDAHF